MSNDHLRKLLRDFAEQLRAADGILSWFEEKLPKALERASGKVAGNAKEPKAASDDVAEPWWGNEENPAAPGFLARSGIEQLVVEIESLAPSGLRDRILERLKAELQAIKASGRAFDGPAVIDHRALLAQLDGWLAELSEEGSTDAPSRESDAVPATECVTLLQMAAIVKRGKRAIERLKRNMGDEFPSPVNAPRKGQAALYRWSEVRVILAAHYNMNLPETFPNIKVVSR